MKKKKLSIEKKIIAHVQGDLRHKPTYALKAEKMSMRFFPKYGAHIDQRREDLQDEPDGQDVARGICTATLSEVHLSWFDGLLIDMTSPPNVSDTPPQTVL